MGHCYVHFAFLFTLIKCFYKLEVMILVCQCVFRNMEVICADI